MPIGHDLAQSHACLLRKRFTADMKPVEDIEAVFRTQPEPALRRLREAEHGQVVEPGFLLEAVDPKRLGSRDTGRGANQHHADSAPGDESDSTEAAKLGG